jgi:hypothetical protein
MSIPSIFASGDGARATAAILTLLSDEASGLDINSYATEVVQVRAAVGREQLYQERARARTTSTCKPGPFNHLNLQGVFHGKWNIQVKRLAYELCKAVPISDEDTLMHILPGIKVGWISVQ